MRFAVLGDVGGHHDAMVAEVQRLGADPETGTLPDDLTIVQVGDLVHRGPASEQVVATVDRFLEHGEGRWVQLVGNHEAQYLRHPAFHWDSWVAEETADTLRRWWADHTLRAAAVIRAGSGEVLVTHAGLTEGFWRRDLGSPATASEAAAKLNEMAAKGSQTLFRPGYALTGGKANFRAGPLWAEAGGELIGSWQERDMPFSQVHGHSSLYDWRAGRWRAAVQIAAATLLDPVSSHETTWMPGGLVVGVDPGHGPQPNPHWRAWMSPEQMHPEPAV